MGGLDSDEDTHQTTEQPVPGESTTATRVGVDIGGTFTDIVLYDDLSGEVRLGKVPTVASALEQGVEAGISSLLSRSEVDACEYFLHGTTVGTNAILQRSGPVVGLLATRGFRDVLEIRRTDRVDPYELLTTPWVPIVPRRLRLPVTERIRGSGEVHTPIEADDVRRALASFENESVEAIAIAFLNSFANPAHELFAERILREAGFTSEISLSHQVSGEYREYERTATAVVDCYVRPSMRAYLTDLERGLGEVGFAGELLMVRPDGGAISFGEAKERPFETILSGPVGGVQGTSELARTLELGDVVTADVGGTSFDTAVVSDGKPHLMYEGEVAGMPIQTAWVDVRSIGAGGGSVAYVDAGGLLKVGPTSAGAYPGPACYARGGTEPTVTDGALCLGLLPDVLASGLRLDRARAEAALAPLAEALAFDIAAVARGIVLIASAAMAGKMHEITVEQGRDPRLLTLVAYGGAGPLFATLLARELDIPRVVIPSYPGNFSAWGMLGVDLRRTATRTRVMKLGDSALEVTNQLLPELFSASAARAKTNGKQRLHEVALDMRYEGQEHTVTVAVPTNEDRIELTAGELHELFTQQYLETFSYTLEFEPEIVTLRATLREPLPRRKTAALAPPDSTTSQQSQTRSAYSFVHDEWLDFALVGRAELGSGTMVAGPAIVLEETATTYLDAGFQASVDPSGALFIGPAEAS